MTRGSDGGEIRVDGQELKKVKQFKYLGDDQDNDDHDDSDGDNDRCEAMPELIK